MSNRERKTKPVTRTDVYRARIQFAKGEVTLPELEARFERKRKWVLQMLHGTLKITGYRSEKIPNRYVIKQNLITAARTLTREQVIEARRAYDAREKTQHQLALDLNISQQNVCLMLSGQTYKDVPGAVEQHNHGAERFFTDDEVREYRRLYTEGAITQTAIATRHNTIQKTVSAMLRGYSYKHVPGHCETALFSTRRCLTQAQVIEARKLFGTRKFRVAELAAYYETCPKVLRAALTGETFRELPGAKPITYAAAKPKQKKRIVMTFEEIKAARAMIAEVIKAAGSQKKLAADLGVSLDAVYNWHLKGVISNQMIDRVVEYSGLSKEKLRPDLFRAKPNLKIGVPRKAELAMLVRVTLDGLDNPNRFNMAAPNYDLIDA